MRLFSPDPSFQTFHPVPASSAWNCCYMLILSSNPKGQLSLELLYLIFSILTFDISLVSVMPIRLVCCNMFAIGVTRKNIGGGQKYVIMTSQCQRRLLSNKLCYDVTCMIIDLRSSWARYYNRAYERRLTQISTVILLCKYSRIETYIRTEGANIFGQGSI